MQTHFLSGKVWKNSLPLVDPAAADGHHLKRLRLPQGELARLHDGEPGMRYIAMIQLLAGTCRGNHFHKAKEEFIYLLAGECQLHVEDVSSKHREVFPFREGDLVFIATGVAHTLEVTQSGQAIEFSQAGFDDSDIFRYPLI